MTNFLPKCDTGLIFLGLVSHVRLDAYLIGGSAIWMGTVRSEFTLTSYKNKNASQSAVLSPSRPDHGEMPTSFLTSRANWDPNTFLSCFYYEGLSFQWDVSCWLWIHACESQNSDITVCTRGISEGRWCTFWTGYFHVSPRKIFFRFFPLFIAPNRKPLEEKPFDFATIFSQCL